MFLLLSLLFFWPIFGLIMLGLYERTKHRVFLFLGFIGGFSVCVLPGLAAAKYLINYGVYTTVRGFRIGFPPMLPADCATAMNAGWHYTAPCHSVPTPCQLDTIRSSLRAVAEGGSWDDIWTNDTKDVIRPWGVLFTMLVVSGIFLANVTKWWPLCDGCDSTHTRKYWRRIGQEASTERTCTECLERKVADANEKC